MFLQIRLQVCPPKVGLGLLQIKTGFKVRQQVGQGPEMFPCFGILEKMYRFSNRKWIQLSPIQRVFKKSNHPPETPAMCR